MEATATPGEAIAEKPVKPGHIVIDGNIHASLKSLAAQKKVGFFGMCEEKLKELLVESGDLHPGLDPLHPQSKVA